MTQFWNIFDTYLWGHLRHFVYKAGPENIEGFKKRIIFECGKINEDFIIKESLLSGRSKAKHKLSAIFSFWVIQKSKNAQDKVGIDVYDNENKHKTHCKTPR